MFQIIQKKILKIKYVFFTQKSNDKNTALFE